MDATIAQLQSDLGESLMKHLATLALVLPSLTIIALIARAEAKLRDGVEWTVPISGYDPRDMLQGHYLNYRVDWDAGQCPNNVSSCCLCLSGEAGERPSARRISCDEKDSDCRSLVSAAGEASLRQYYVPENAAEDVAQRLRDKGSSLRIVVSPHGDVRVKQLLIDGQSWPR